MHFDKKKSTRIYRTRERGHQHSSEMRIGQCSEKYLKGFERYSVDDFQWGQLTAHQRLRTVDVFKKATMNDKEEFFEEYLSQCSSKQGLSLSWKQGLSLSWKQGLPLSAKDCKIDKVPLSILEVMYEKVLL